MLNKYWVRGSLITLTLGILAIAFLLVFSLPVHDVGDAYGKNIGTIFSFISLITLIKPLSDQGFSFVESMIIIIPYFTIIGSILGGLYGKLKTL
jgi:hypothetical protein